ncbi:MAG: YraN family protein [Chitinophagaceae bacterium]
MASHNELGKEGEELAVKWLRENGYTILHCNWRYSHYELDIVATKIHPNEKRGEKEFLHFIEVKTRQGTSFGHPEESVTKKKFKHLQKAADEYLYQHPGYKWIQYDILAITLQKNGEVEYFLLQDVFL